ncbi:CPBP family intramembrane glutamic endopeptidase [Candidatus Enterococcus mansonii]|uniref:CAAX prenyl protease 2/Lysostaphin resistance protein A-like domain-containing protein n=1 Tax=Candidatus Enterococcus mansonii TaxID=1834181 RepID=A0A242CIW2_9ENTE|nr:CPBP family intramembrane glutamic endopeptidase [Enterococcus sp. 4G2_DIV0659]OTO10187.1 hypothetical protein A5880_000870 [Enterococcus sp. 4G2_DIV0659]
MKKEEVKRGWRIILTMLYGLLSAAISLGIPLGIGLVIFGRSGMNETVVDVTNMLTGIIGTPLMILLTKRYYQKHYSTSLETFDFFERGSIRKIGFGFFLGVLMMIVLFGIVCLLGASVEYKGFDIKWFSTISGILTFIGMAVVEECIFRGLLPEAFSTFGNKAALIIPAGLFVAMHMDLWSNPDILRMIDLFVVGILFMTILKQTKSLVFVSAFHAANNITVMILGIEMDDGILKTSYNQQLFGLSADQLLAMCSISISLAVIIGLYFRKKHIRIV